MEGAVTVSRTGTSTGWPPVGVIRIVPLYGPAVSPLVFTPTEMVAGVLALAGVTVSQAGLLSAETVNGIWADPETAFDTCNWAEGAVPPIV